MTEQERAAIIDKFKDWFRDNLAFRHKANTEKLTDITEFKINPFLLHYLSSFLEGNTNPDSLAKALVYPRILGTSITTSFGMGMQKFITGILGTYGSVTSGIDIEFMDHGDGRKKYCQLKSGPNALNRDDVDTIDNHFKDIRNLAKTNNLKLQYGDLVFALLYGERSELNSFISELEKRDVVVYVGQEFWERFTGDPDFYRHLIVAAGEVAQEVNMKETVNEVIASLSQQINQRYDDLFG